MDACLDYFTQTSLVSFLVDAQSGGVLDASHGACNFYGYRLSHFKTLSIKDLAAAEAPMPDFSQHHSCFFTLHRSSSDEIKRVILFCAPVALAECEASLVIVNTEMQDDLNQFHSMIESLPLGVYRVNLEGEITFANKALLNSLHLSLADVLGKTAFDLYPQELAEKYHRDNDFVISADKGIRRTEENLDSKTGEIHYVEVIKTPVIDNAGNVVGLQGLSWDVSERYEQALLMEKSDALLKTIAEQSPNYVMLLDSELRLTYLNRAILGFTKDELLGSYLPDLATDKKNTIEKILAETIETGDMGVYETDYVQSEGGSLYFETRAIRLNTEIDGARLYLTAIDITDRVLHEHQLQQSAAVFTHSKESIVITNKKGVIDNFNDAFSQLVDRRGEKIFGQTIYQLLNIDITRQEYRDMRKVLAEQGFWKGDQKILNQKGKPLILMAAVSAVKDHADVIQSYVVLLSDITTQKEHQKQLERIAHYDPLTNLPNRHSLNLHLNHLMDAANNSGDRLAVLYIDLDGFKAVNDCYGHHKGDQILIDIARRLTSTIKDNDLAARLGGDEFVVISPGIDKHGDTGEYFKSILNALSFPVHLNHGVVEISASLGVTYFPQSIAVDADHLIRQADLAMYQAKVHGKNCYRNFDEEKDRNQRDYGRILAELSKALIVDELRLYYQPKVNMRSGEIIGVEALVRWQHSRQGLLMPDQFLPATNDDVLAIYLDNWVIENALSQLCSWIENGFCLELNINVSIKRIESGGFVEWMKAVLARFPPINPSLVTIEILESGAVEDVDLVSQAISACKALGIKFSLDDFGTGFSTLAFLKNLPVDELKIDRSFVRDMLEDVSDMAIIRGILGLANAFDKQVVAEGVETEEHGCALLGLGCELAQGYGIARPMSADKLVSWSQSWKTFPRWVELS